MGKAMRWLRGLLGMKKDKEKENSNSVPFRERISWRFRKSARESGIHQETNKDWMRSYLAEKEEQHAIAVAAATTAAANAAVAAARAAVEVVKLTTQSRANPFPGEGDWLKAAVKIQSFYRGHLARRALRALKGLVKLQAVVRGYIVRKQVAATFQSMQTLIQAQTRCLVDKQRRLSKEEEKRTTDESPKIVEIDTCRSIQTPLISENGDNPYWYYPTSSSSPFRHSRKVQDSEWSFIINGEGGCRFSTPQPSRIARSCGDYINGPSTPSSSKSVCGGGSLLRSYSNVPKYMTSTESFSAKLRSHSAPRQRAEEGSCGNTRKRKSFNDRFLAFNMNL